MQEQPVMSFRLSPQQGRLWSSRADTRKSGVQAALGLEGSVDADSLRTALECVVARHEILRTTYHLPAGIRMPLQVVGEGSTCSWSTRDALGASPDDLLAAERCHEIDLARGPALRACLACVEEDRHVLTLTLPALSADAGTFSLIADELAALYTAEERRLVPEPLQYADYAEWQRELCEGEDADLVRSQWTAQRLEEIPPLQLPAGSAGVPPGAVTARIKLSPKTAAAIRAAATELDADVGAFVLAGWEAVLARITETADLAVDVIADGRHDEALASALGLLAKPVRIRASVQSGSTFGALVGSAKSSLQNAREWQDGIMPGTDLAPSAAFEWISEDGARQLGGLSLSVDARWSIGAHGLVQLTAIATAGTLSLEVSGDAGAISPEAARRLVGQVARFLTGAAEEPDARTEAIELLTDEERALIRELNDTGAEIPSVAGIHELFARQAHATPDRPALVADGVVLDYGELNARANRLARALRASDARPNVAVGIFLERSLDSVVALLGVLKAGAAALPLAVEHPAARVEQQLRESEAQAIVTLTRFAERLPVTWDGATICLDSDAEAIAAEPATDPEPITTLADLAYIVYTSGSTGSPKGVGVTHLGIVNYAADMCRRLSLQDGEAHSFALVSPTITDLGNTCLYPSLVSGGCLHVIDESTAMDGALYAAYAGANPIDVLKVTPSHLTALLATGEGDLVLPRRQLVLGGERLSWELVQRVLDRGCAVLNHYGPTEATVGSMTCEVTSELVRERRTPTVPIGHPISNTEVLILDVTGRPTPVGVAGELYIGGAGLASGYVGRSEETAERFVSHLTRPGERLYRTGDLARLWPGGEVEFLGRIDRQVKVRGFRVEPAEVEALLVRDPRVRQSAVIMREDQPGDQRLVAYVVPAGTEAPCAEELRDLVAADLPDFMVPSAFVAIDGLPLSPNGKLDTAVLPAPDRGRRNGHQEHTGPRDEIEHKLAAIWAEVLGVEQIGVEDDFFELGGHSLLATQVIARVRNGLGVQLPLHTLFTSPTIGGLAVAVRETQQAASADEQELAAMLEELESMSDEDAERLLSLESAAEE